MKNVLKYVVVAVTLLVVYKTGQNEGVAKAIHKFCEYSHGGS